MAAFPQGAVGKLFTDDETNDFYQNQQNDRRDKQHDRADGDVTKALGGVDSLRIEINHKRGKYHDHSEKN